MAYKRSDPVIYSILKFSEGYLRRIKIDSVSFAVPSTRVEHVKIKTRNKIAAGKKQPLWYLMCYFNLTGVCICPPPPQKKNNNNLNVPVGQEYLPEHLQNLFCLLQRATTGS